MTMTAKILGQALLATATDTSIYTVPAAASATCSSIVVCNTSPSTPTTYRLAVRPAAEGSTTAKNYLVYEQNIDPRETVSLTLGISLATGDTLRGYAGSAAVTFSVFGVERT